jgi:hypothetical protein
MPGTPRTLGQLIAVERALRQEDNNHGSRLKHGAKESLFTGEVRTYKSHSENPPPSEHWPAQYKELQRRVEDDLDEARQYAVPAMNIVASKDATNTIAKADVIVRGNTLLRDVPVSHLLWLEKYLTEYRGYFTALPVNKPDKEWTWSETERLWRSRLEETPRTDKVLSGVTLHPGSDKHPPVVQAVTKDVPIGLYQTIVLSGAISASRKKELLDKITEVILAVKDAIAVADRTPVVEVREGDAIFKFILGR